MAYLISCVFSAGTLARLKRSCCRAISVGRPDQLVNHRAVIIGHYGMVTQQLLAARVVSGYCRDCLVGTHTVRSKNLIRSKNMVRSTNNAAYPCDAGVAAGKCWEYALLYACCACWKHLQYDGPLVGLSHAAVRTPQLDQVVRLCCKADAATSTHGNLLLGPISKPR